MFWNLPLRPGFFKQNGTGSVPPPMPFDDPGFNLFQLRQCFGDATHRFGQVLVLGSV